MAPKPAVHWMSVDALLRPWAQQPQSERTGTTPISKALAPEQQKIQEQHVSAGFDAKKQF